MQEEPGQQTDDDAGSAQTRPQRGGEGGTTRFGMENGENTDVPDTGLDPDQQEAGG